MRPSIKDEEVEQFLEKLSGRTAAIRANRCINPPLGCGKSVIGEFRDVLSLKEYKISGLCQICQDEIFDGEIPADDID